MLPFQSFNLNIMKLTIKHQEKFSRSELLLRFLFGTLYITLPHAFLLFFISLWGLVLNFAAFIIVVFTEEYPQSVFEFNLQIMRWKLRLNARLFNLSDGYPAFGLTGTDEEYTQLELPYPEKISRSLVLLRFFFGFIFIGIPHGFLLFFRTLFGVLISLFAWFSVLFTGTYTKRWHDFMVGTMRWQYRVAIYWAYMTDEYPPFSGKE